MEGSENSNGVGEAGGVTKEIDVAVGIIETEVFVGMITVVGELAYSGVGVAGAPQATRTNPNNAIASELLFMFNSPCTY